MSKKFIILNTILREGGFSDNPYDNVLLVDDTNFGGTIYYEVWSWE